MWCSLVAGHAHPVLHQSGLKKAPNDEKKAFVADPARDSGHQNIVVYPVEELLQIEIHDKFTPLLRHVFPSLLQSHVRASSGPESVAGVGKGGVEDGIQYLQNHLLNQTIHNHWNAQLALSSSRLRNLHSTNRLGPISPFPQ